MTESNDTHLQAPWDQLTLYQLGGLYRIWLGWIYQVSGMIAESLGSSLWGQLLKWGRISNPNRFQLILRTVFSSKLAACCLKDFWLRKPKSWKKTNLLRCGQFFGTVSRELCGNFRWQMPGPMWKRPGVPFVYALRSLWTFWRRYPWTVGRLDVSWTFRAVILREYGRKVFFYTEVPRKVNLHEPPHNDTLDS